NDDAVLALAAAAESDSEHPLGRAIVTAARKRAAEVPAASHFRSMAGRGVEATVAGDAIAVGGPALLRERGMDVPANLRDPIHTWERRGAAVLFVVRDDRIVGALALEDRIR